jgi:uncharacterized RDD family membrane protein YckC
MYAHLDRVTFPDRLQMVRDEIGLRLKTFDELGQNPDLESGKAAGFFRRWWASLVDLFVHLLILCALFLVGYGAISLKSGFAPQEPNSVQAGFPQGPTPFQQFISGLVTGEKKAWTDMEQWAKLGGYASGFLVFKALLTIPAWRRSGSTPGMREAGIALRDTHDKKPTLQKCLLRFLVQYPLFIITGGVSALWILWDRKKLSLHDRLVGTRVVRVSRTWELPDEVRILE